MFKRLRKDEKGFTLMEIVIVIVILGILALLAIPRLLGFTEQAEIASDKEYAAVVARAAELYWASHDKAITPDADGDDQSTTNNGTIADFVDADVQVLIDQSLIDDPDGVLQYNNGTFISVVVGVDSDTGVATVVISYVAGADPESITFSTDAGYTLTGI